MTEYQKKPDFVKSKSEYDETVYNTNPRYTNFCQTHFTAGDIEQFERFRSRTNGKNPLKKIETKDNVWEPRDFCPQIDWTKYASLTTEAVDNTFFYLFEKFKKGVFVKIKDNKLAVFLPFSKHNYTNEWSHLIRVPDVDESEMRTYYATKEYKDYAKNCVDRGKQPEKISPLQYFLIKASELQGYMVTPDKVNKFVNTWYANNCLVRPEFPVGENDRCMANLRDLLMTLCNEREVPDIELFFNRRDFPLIKMDDTEPYDHLFNHEKVPLISHNYKKYCPILSMVTTKNNGDIPFPTMEDWARASFQSDQKLFAPDFRTYEDEFMDWKSKIPTAVFRGASTGCGVTIETNPRLKLAYMSAMLAKMPPVVYKDSKRLLDAGITKWNCRPRKIANEYFLQVLDKNKLGLDLVAPLTPQEQSRYKYIVNVDGHVSAFRLSLELSMGSVVLLQDSKYKVWFRDSLVPYVHYVPIKEDLSDLYDRIRWCIDHDKECQEIARQARLFYDTYLSKKGILDYAQLLFVKIKKATGTYFYNYESVKNLIYKKQLECIPPVGIEQSLSYPFTDRNYNAMAGLEMYTSKHPLLEQLKFESLLYPLKKKSDSKIDLYSLQSLKINVKTSTREKELVNEAFIGLKCVNRLLRDIPNFRYTFGMQDKTLFTEHIAGMTFSNYMKECTIIDMNLILQLLFLTLAVAQEKCGFVHNDLMCWNIVIQKLDAPKRIVYQFKDQIFVVNTTIVPIIIDYDRSHAIYEELHYGIIHPFKSSTVQDCFSVIINSIQEFSARKLGKPDIDSLLYMANFFTETQFHKSKLTNFSELLEFVTQNKKYNEIVYRNKCDLEFYQPADFLLYFRRMVQTSSTIQIQHVIGQSIDREFVFVNPLFYYNMIISKDNEEDMNLYLDKISQKMKEIDKFLPNFIYYVYMLNQVHKVVTNLLPIANPAKCEKLLSELDKLSQKTGETKLVVPTCRFSLAKYTPATFSMPSMILSLIQGNVNVKRESSLYIRNMVIDMLLFKNKYPFQPKDLRMYGSICELSPLAILNHNANINTLRWISKKLYRIDKSKLEALDPSLRQIETFNDILVLC